MTSNEYTVKSTQRNTRPDDSQPCSIFPLRFRTSAFNTRGGFPLGVHTRKLPENYFIKKKERLPLFREPLLAS